MSARRRRFFKILLAGTATACLPAGSSAQTMYAANIVHLQPAWRTPTGTSTVTAYNATAANTGGVYVSSGSPYYTDSPLYRTVGIVGGAPAASAVSTPAPWDASGRPAIVPDQMIQPLVSTPSGPVPAAPASTSPQPATGGAPIQPASQSTPVFPSAPAWPSAPAAAAPPEAAPPSPAALNPAPFVDPDVFTPSGQSWVEIDITPYTGRFSPTAEAHASVRGWIIRKTDPSSWLGGEVASLVVSPERVRIYHTPAVQQQVRDLLGRMLYYTPGEFQTRVQVVNVRNSRWRAEAGSALTPAGSSGKVWIGRLEDLAEISASITSRDSGTLLANPEVVVFNGQKLHVGWSPHAGRDPDPQRTGRPVEEGVVVDVSPLIDSDAASVELDVSAAVRRDAPRATSLLGTAREFGASKQIEEGSVRELVSTPPGYGVVASLGQVASFDDSKGFLGRSRSAEVVVIVACRPSPNNTINGRPIVLASASPPQRSTSHRPTESTPAPTRPSSRLPKPFLVPPELTRPVD